MSFPARRLNFTAVGEVSHIMRFLKDEFPISKSMYQVVKDTRDGVMEANVFTDDWPHFTTVVSQEFVPKLSEVADIRIFTRDREKVMKVLNSAKLLERASSRQFIFILTSEDGRKSTVRYLEEALLQHSVVKSRGLNLEVRSLPVYTIEKPISVPSQAGYIIKDLLPEHMGGVAENWNFPDWFTEFTPLEVKKEYVTELQRRFHVMGLFPLDNPTQPIAWTCRKSGGCHGISFTVKEERGKLHSVTLIAALGERVLSKSDGDVVLYESAYPAEMERIGDMHVLMLLNDSKARNRGKL